MPAALEAQFKDLYGKLLRGWTGSFEHLNQIAAMPVYSGKRCTKFTFRGILWDLGLKLLEFGIVRGRFQDGTPEKPPV
jgi:hypothetical protein